MISYADRTNISIAELDMKKELHLSDTTLGIINSSFFWGYAITQIIGGWIADKYGGKLVLLVAVSGWSFFTFIVPFAVQRGLAIFIIARMLLGAAEGVGFPAVHSMLGRWIPKNERSRAVSIVTAFSYLGAILSSIVASALLGPYGWRSVFYSFGLIGMLWCIPWIYFAENEPPEHKAQRFDELETFVVSASDRSYSRIKHELSSSESDESPEVENEGLISSDVVQVLHSQQIGTPWRRIFLAKEVWAIIINQFAQSWGFFTVLFYLPTYFESVHGLKSDQAGFMTVLPNLIQVILF
jgi:MFS family permease